MAKVVSEAIVLRLVDFGEADRVVTLLTPGHGKVDALARGARRSRKRFGAALGLFGVGEAVLVERRGALWGLESFHAGRVLARLGQDVARLAHGAYACELVRELAAGPDERVFRLLARMLDLIDGNEPSVELLRAFELHLLDALGVAPSLDRCLRCGRVGQEIEGHFDARHGGLVCDACSAAPAVGRRISRGLRAAMLRAQRGELGGAPTMGSEDREAAREILQATLLEHLGKPLRSVEFIAKLNRSPA